MNGCKRLSFFVICLVAHFSVFSSESHETASIAMAMVARSAECNAAKLRSYGLSVNMNGISTTYAVAQKSVNEHSVYRGKIKINGVWASENDTNQHALFVLVESLFHLLLPQGSESTDSDWYVCMDAVSGEGDMHRGYLLRSNSSEKHEISAENILRARKILVELYKLCGANSSPTKSENER